MNTRAQATDENDSSIARDGETIVVKMVNMRDGAAAPFKSAVHQITIADGARHRPSFASISDADVTTRQTAYDGYAKRLAEAFTNPPPLVIDKAPTKVVASDFYAAHDAKLSEQWRQA